MRDVATSLECWAMEDADPANVILARGECAGRRSVFRRVPLSRAAEAGLVAHVEDCNRVRAGDRTAREVMRALGGN